MVTIIGSALFQCEACGFRYEDKKWVKECEAYCRSKKACNPDIIKHATN